MRIIKFRAITFISEEVIYGSYATDGKDYHAIISPCHDDDEQMFNHLVNGKTVGQFTGLQDKNGVDIYEGDIVKETRLLHNGACSANHEVEFKAPSFVVGDLELKTFMGITREVVGNIHENPELIS